jgi:hypothetical protein
MLNVTKYHVYPYSVFMFFCLYLITSSYYFSVQHSLGGLCNREREREREGGEGRERERERERERALRI